MRTLDLHPWNVSPTEARMIQTELRNRVDRTSRVDIADIKLVGGVDATYFQIGEDTFAVAGVIVLSFPDLEVVEEVTARQLVTFPYVPGLLTFREGPAVLEAARKVHSEPDVIIFDGQGYAHPRRIGVASHLGVFLDRPSIGCAKSKLIGKIEEEIVDNCAPLTDRGERIGTALHTRPRARPLIISAGHRICLEDAVAITRACCRGGRRLPVPTRLAHEMVGRERSQAMSKANR